jgi:hypothetical protein
MSMPLSLLKVSQDVTGTGLSDHAAVAPPGSEMLATVPSGTSRYVKELDEESQNMVP